MSRYPKLVQLEYLARLMQLVLGTIVEIDEVTRHETVAELDFPVGPNESLRWKNDSRTTWRVKFFSRHNNHGPQPLVQGDAADAELVDLIFSCLSKVLMALRPKDKEWQDVASDMIRFGQIDEALKLIHEKSPPAEPLSKTLTVINRTIAKQTLTAFANFLTKRNNEARVRYSRQGVFAHQSVEPRIEGEEAAAAIALNWLPDDLHEYDDSNATTGDDPYRGCARCGKLRGDHP